MGIPPKVGDTVIAYYDDGPCAFGGVMHKLNKDGQAFVEYDGDHYGETAWVDSQFVHKFIPIK